MSAYRENSTARATFSLREGDVMDASAHLIKSGPLENPIAITAGIFVVAAAVESLVLDGAARYAAVLLLIGIGGWLCWLLKKQTRNSLAKGVERLDALGRFQFTADEEGVVVESERVQWSLAWRHIEHWDETAESFLVFLDTRRYQIVPKRGFEAAAGATTLRQMLTDHARQDASLIDTRQFADWLPWLVLITWVATLIGSVAEFLGR